jgi:hypothetical protein
MKIHSASLIFGPLVGALFMHPMRGIHFIA